MGLAIGVGLVAQRRESDPEAVARIRADISSINAILEQRDHPIHQEPESFEKTLTLRASVTSFPYSWLHYLRRFAAHVMRDPKWVPYPIEPGEDPAKDNVLVQMYRRLSSHLLCHSDREGYYVPVDFQELILDPGHEITGGVVGSSFALRRELITLCDPLEIDVDDEGNLSDENADRLSKQRPSGAPFAIERLVWLALYEAARVSIEEETAIVFC